MLRIVLASLIATGCIKGPYKTRLSVRDPNLVQIVALRDGKPSGMPVERGLVSSGNYDRAHARKHTVRRDGDNLEMTWSVTIRRGGFRRDEEVIHKDPYLNRETVRVTTRYEKGEYDHYKTITPASNVTRIRMRETEFRKDGLAFLAAGLGTAALGYWGSKSDHFFFKYPGYFFLVFGVPLGTFGLVNVLRPARGEDLPIPPAQTALPPTVDR